jgi:hypothetical protein
MEGGFGGGFGGGFNDGDADGLEAKVLAIGEDEKIGGFYVNAAPEAVGGGVFAIGLALRGECIRAAAGEIEGEDTGALGGVGGESGSEEKGASGEHTDCDCCIDWRGGLNVLNGSFTGRLQ